MHVQFLHLWCPDYHVPSNSTVWYCLSDGTKWMFQAYTSDAQGNHISYGGPLLTIMQPHLEVGEDFKKDVQHLMELLYVWLQMLNCNNN